MAGQPGNCMRDLGESAAGYTKPLPTHVKSDNHQTFPQAASASQHHPIEAEAR